MTIESRIADLKRVKVPLWARWLGYFAARRRRKEAAKEIKHIATVYHWQYWSDVKYYNHSWYICKQSGTGRRSYEYGYNSSLLERKEKLTTVYASVIVPWLLGNYTNNQLVDYAAKAIKQPTRSE